MKITRTSPPTARYTRRVSATDLARRLGEYLAQVSHGGVTLLIEKNRKPVAELRPAAGAASTLREVRELWGSHRTDPGFAADLEWVNKSDKPPEIKWDS